MSEWDIVKLVIHSVCTGCVALFGIISTLVVRDEWVKAKQRQSRTRITDRLRRFKVGMVWEVAALFLLALGWVMAPISLITLLIILGCCVVMTVQMVTEFKQDWTEHWFTPFFGPYLKFLFNQELTKEDILATTDPDTLWAIAKRMGREKYVEMFRDREHEINSDGGARLIITWGELRFIETNDINGIRAHRVDELCATVKEAKLYLFGYIPEDRYSRGRSSMKDYKFVLET